MPVFGIGSEKPALPRQLWRSKGFWTCRTIRASDRQKTKVRPEKVQRTHRPSSRRAEFSATRNVVPAFYPVAFCGFCGSQKTNAFVNILEFQNHLRTLGRDFTDCMAFKSSTPKPKVLLESERELAGKLGHQYTSSCLPTSIRMIVSSASFGSLTNSKMIRKS